MGYRIRMVPEIEKWLADIRDSDPAAADRIDQAVATLRAGGENVGAPLVVLVDDPASHRSAVSNPRGRAAPRGGGLNTHLRSAWRRMSASGGPRWPLAESEARSVLPGLDAAYQRQLDKFARVRRSVAIAATSRKQLELQIAQLEQQINGLRNQSHEALEGSGTDIAEARRSAADEQLADLHRQYAAIKAEEQRAVLASQRLKSKVEAFRAQKEATKAAYMAAEETAEAVLAEVSGNLDADAEGVRATAAEPANVNLGDSAQPALWLSELRPGAPEWTDCRILFTVEPSGTAVFLAAGMENDWLHAWYPQAVALCGIRYQREHGIVREP
jgi:hypothetical protein